VASHVVEADIVRVLCRGGEGKAVALRVPRVRDDDDDDDDDDANDVDGV